MPHALAPILLALPLLPLRQDADPSHVDLAAALPADAEIVVLVGDLAAATGEDAGRWGRMLGDPRWSDVLRRMARALGGEPALDEFRIAADVTRGVRAAAVGWTDASVGQFVGAFSVDEGWLGSARAALAADGVLTEDATAAGAHGFVLPAETSPLLLVVRDGIALVASHREAGAAEEAIAEAFARLDAGEREGWRPDGVGRVPGAQVEVFVEAGRLVGEPDPFAGELGTFYSGVALGDGPNLEVAFRMSYAGAPISDAVAGALDEADAGLLGLTPEGYDAVVLGIDVHAAVDAALTIAEVTIPDARERFESTIEDAGTLLGVDVEEALLDNLTGQLVMLWSLSDVRALTDLLAEDPELLAEDADVEAPLLPLLALGAEDPELLLESVDVVAAMVESGGVPVERFDVGDASVWSFEAEPDLTIAAGLGSGFVTVGGEDGVTEFLASLADPERPRALDPEVLADLAGELAGSLVMASSMDTWLVHADLLVAEKLAELATLVDDEIGPSMEAWRSDVARILRDHLAGTYATTVHVDPRRFSLRCVCR